MNVVAFILILIAVILFATASFGVNHPRFTLIPAGLAFLAAGLIFEFASKSHTFTF
jgi:hypothetical protein